MKPNSNLLNHHLGQLKKVAMFLTEHHISIREARIDRRYTHPRLVVDNSGHLNQLTWYCYAWGRDDQGHYRRFSAVYAGVQIVREERI